MDHGPFEILRQSGFDLWTWVCIFAAVVLASYALVTRLWTSRQQWLALGMIGAGVGGTILVVVFPDLHSPFVGLIWTFVLLCLLSATFYLNLQDQLGRKRMLSLLAMRIAALALLVPMLFEPVIRYVTKPVAERPLIFLVDTSGSMSVPDVPNGPTRIQSVWQTLRPQLDKINEHFVPKYFTFSTGVQPLDKPDDLAKTIADGKSTDILQAIGAGLSASDRDDAIVMLVSDGQDNVSPDVISAVRDARRKVCTITVGSDQAEPASLPNVAVDNVACDEDFSVGHESTLVATIKSSALPNRLVEVKMAEIDDSGQPTGDVQIKQLVLQPVAKGQTVNFPYTPQTVGVHKLAVWIDPIPGERTVADNRQEFQGLALDPRIKVLYIEGTLRPEYKYLRRVLGSDPNIEESYHVMLQSGKADAGGEGPGRQLKQLPTTLDDWKKFDVIILGDMPATFFTPSQQSALEQAVAAGAGLVMFGGENNFGPGGFAGTPIEQALPVSVGEKSSPQEMSQFVPQLTIDGQGHPALEGLADWLIGPNGQKPQKDLPPLRGNVVVASAKTGAQTLLVHPGHTGPDGKPQIVLAVERYGKGRSAAFTADTTYLWYLTLREEGQNSPFNRFWGQLIRWLAGADVRNRQSGAGMLGLLDKTSYQFGETARVRALVRDERGDATQYAQVTMTLHSATQNVPPKQLPLSPVPLHIGMYEIRIPDADHGIEALRAGEYSLDLVATKDGKELGRQSLKFSITPPDDEMLKIAANPDLMKKIAEATGGFSRELDGMPALLDQLIRTDPNANQSNERTVPLANTFRALLAAAGSNPQWSKKYDLPMQGLLVVTLLAVEWVLRRRWQLP